MRLSLKERIAIRKMRNERLAQLEMIRQLEIPVKDNIRLIDSVLKGERPVEHLLKHSKQVHEYFEAWGFFK